jgi:hypothetical protein
MVENAAKTTSTFSYNNALSRYSCNQTINNTTIAAAQSTYKKLYDIYSTKDPSSCVSDNSFDPNDCINSSCPHNIGLALNDTPNVFYFTQRTCGNNQIKLAVRDLAGYLDDCGAQIRTYNTANNNAAAYAVDASFSIMIDTSFNSLLKTRSDLDNKMNEILGNNPNSILYEKQNQLDASIYTTLLWTVLVTSSLYYIFTKI